MKQPNPIDVDTALDLTSVTDEYRDYEVDEIDLFVTKTEKFAEAVKTHDIELGQNSVCTTLKKAYG